MYPHATPLYNNKLMEFLSLFTYPQITNIYCVDGIVISKESRSEIKRTMMLLNKDSQYAEMDYYENIDTKDFISHIHAPLTEGKIVFVYMTDATLNETIASQINYLRENYSWQTKIGPLSNSPDLLSKPHENSRIFFVFQQSPMKPLKNAYYQFCDHVLDLRSL